MRIMKECCGWLWVVSLVLFACALTGCPAQQDGQGGADTATTLDREELEEQAAEEAEAEINEDNAEEALDAIEEDLEAELSEEE